MLYFTIFIEKPLRWKNGYGFGNIVILDSLDRKKVTSPHNGATQWGHTMGPHNGATQWGHTMGPGLEFTHY
jgi:hypothetical protein